MVGAAPPRGAVGRADLVRAFVARGEDELERLARRLGYREVERRSVVVQGAEASAGAGTTAGPVTVTPAEPSGRPRFSPVPFWRLESVERLDDEGAPGDGEPEREVEVLSPGELAPEGEAPEPAPIVPWPRLWPALREALRTPVPSREIDVRALVERWGRGELLDRLPCRPASAWSRRVTLLVDRGRRLIPFWHDQDLLGRKLRRLLGRGELRVLRGLDGPAGLWAGPAAQRGEQGVPERVATQPGETVLAASDLGFYAGASAADVWARWGRALRRRGARLRALVPCPAARWQRPVAGLWNAVDWTSPLRTAAGGRRPDGAGLAARCERLLRLVSPALRVEPGLLRAIRRLLPARDADAGTEADVWSHPGVDGGSSVALTFDDPAACRRAFHAEPAELRRGVIREIRRWHVALPREIWLEEALALLADAGTAEIFDEVERDELRRFALRLGRTVAGRDAGDAQGAFDRYFVRFARRLPAEHWRDGELRSALGGAWGEVRGGDADLPPGVTPDLVGAGAASPPRDWTVWQVGPALEFRPAGEEPGVPASPLASLSASRPEIDVATAADAWQRRCRLEPEPPPCPLPRGSSMVLSTDRQRARLERFERPDWARRAGRDRCGLWAVSEVEGVEWRWRWIPPGSFWMGSPDDEEGRYGDEGPRHHVTLTRGFWLAETPCTQALWEAVMGGNPSEFKSPDRPVEQVSWEDCARFLEGLNGRVEGLEARLPTEAEWEYACRAGTESSTYVGDLEILGERNAPLLDEIAWYGGNSGVGFELDNGWDVSGWKERQYEHDRAGSHPVARKTSNSWGLYDMLGNVYEWCVDWQGPYGAEPAEDPTGPAEGALRVIRGGSWSGLARYARSACRLWGPPGDRLGHLGFRLARGQKKARSA